MKFNLAKKPLHTGTNIGRSKKGYQICNRHVSNAIHEVRLTFLLEALWIKECFQYSFCISICTACNSKDECPKKIPQSDIQEISQKIMIHPK